jgi:hypothetical protein
MDTYADIEKVQDEILYLLDRAVRVQDIDRARSLLFYWVSNVLPRQVSLGLGRHYLRNPQLWTLLADTVERTNDHYLLELFWQAMDLARLPTTSLVTHLPLMGIPIVNQHKKLLSLLDSIDFSVDTLAIVDNSQFCDSHEEVGRLLSDLKSNTHPHIKSIRIAKSFGNSGVANSWNQILRAFPEATAAMLVNDDVVFAPEAISSALSHVNSHIPQFIPLLPSPQEFSAFLITHLCWNRIGLFDISFNPAYCEDLDYRDRMRADPSIEIIILPDIQQAMLELNQEHSSTITSNPELSERNRCSFALNRLWWLSHRRLRHDPRGTWLRQWLTEWKD